ncbi:MAG: peptide chain release factor N(5)-glutamine methyltransferase [Holophagaceae bacterium]|nr:peptide chain release factor N(5)-glutamine methyltransferase [Holophagaceae bacterium]
MAKVTYKAGRLTLAKSLSAFLDGQEANAESWRWFDEGLGWSKARMYAHGEDCISEEIQSKIAGWLIRRKAGEPWAYILGWVVWRGRRFCVTPATLIPRPETEMVLESALELARLIGAKHVVDVGTGAGILGISLALESSLVVTATDISCEALAVAKQNAKAHDAKLCWVQGNLLEPVANPIEMVISNMPYIPIGHAGELQREIAFEPRTALFAGDMGMELINKLLIQGFQRNAKGIILEIGSEQGEELKSRAKQIGWQNVEIKKDIAGHDRVIVATN